MSQNDVEMSWKFIVEFIMQGTLLHRLGRLRPWGWGSDSTCQTVPGPVSSMNHLLIRKCQHSLMFMYSVSPPTVVEIMAWLYMHATYMCSIHTFMNNLSLTGVIIISFPTPFWVCTHCTPTWVLLIQELHMHMSNQYWSTLQCYSSLPPSWPRTQNKSILGMNY